MNDIKVEPRAPFVIEWRSGFMVNIPQVDQEHQHLFALIKALNLESVEKTVEELVDYVVVHFSNEQALMDRYAYPALNEHLKLHEELGAEVAEFLGSGEPWSEDRVKALRRFLNKWLIGHIMIHDMRFGKWIENRELKNVPVVEVKEVKVDKKGFFGRLFESK